MFWVGVAAVVILVGATLYVLHRRRRRSRLISFVALLREPVSLDPAVLAGTAGRAWDADLGDGSEPGEDGFVVGIGVSCTIMHDGRMFLINSFPKPYLDEVEPTAEKITDLRIRTLFREHTAWLSCDALGVDRRTPEAEVRDWYRRLGHLFAELLDENCLLIFLPCAVPRSSEPATPTTRRTTALGARPTGASSPTARCPACCGTTGRGTWMTCEHIDCVGAPEPQSRPGKAPRRNQPPHFLNPHELLADAAF